MTTPDTGRPLSHWAWGYADRFPDRAAREALAQQLTLFLGLEHLPVREPVALENAHLPSPRVPVPAVLADICTEAPAARAQRCYGRSFPDMLRGFLGDFAAAPDLVCLPRTEAEVVDALRWAQAAGVAVVPYGGGTSVVRGVECDGAGFTGVMCLDMRGLHRVLSVDRASLSACIQAGATGPVLEAQLAEHGLTLRHYPQSFEFSTLGGWIATRAGGHFATLYTHIDDLVQAVRMVTPAGVWQSRRLPGSGAGPDPDRLVLGSEGAFGVITEAWMRVRPRPVFRSSVTLSFPDLMAAADAARRVVQAGLHPSNCRVLDPREARLHAVSFDGDALLLLGFESADHPQVPLLEEALRVGRDAGGTIKDGPRHREGERDRGGAAGSWRQAFIDTPYLFGALVSLDLVADTFETACTWDRFPDLHEAVVKATRGAMKAACGKGLLTTRFTHVYPDGPAPYYTFIAPGRPGERAAQWAAIKAAATEAILAGGGTITHHHAVGRTHRAGYAKERPQPMGAVLRAVKHQLDPAGILNPGVLFDGEG
ncbi:MAG: FAD-binding oxidoreductase [Alphaproteobacteria bacterium]|nr:FAD-binding oxidoreductase [Alphaproteobacteria bacterium]